MPSFDVVSEIDKPELTNAIDQANREISNRFDFKGSDARVEASDKHLSVFADTEFQVQQAVDILYNKLAKRGIDIACIDAKEVEEIGGGKAKQTLVLQEGIDKELAKKIIKLIKDQKLKVQTAIQGEQLRVTGKKRDDLQTVISLLKESKIDLPLQYINFRD